MIGRGQKLQCLIAIRIMLDLIGLRMQCGNDLITLEVMMDNSLPSWNLTLTELWYASCGCVAAFNHGEHVFWSELFICRHVNGVIMCNAAEIDVEHTNRRRIQTLERRRIASKLSLLNVGLKHESTGGDAPGS